MIKKIFITLCFICLFIAGAYGQPKSQNKIKTVFLEMISNELRLLQIEAFKNRDTPKVFQTGNAWHSIYIEWNNEYSYDIKTSNSIISPYIGVVTFYGKAWVKIGTTREECLKAPWRPWIDSMGMPMISQKTFKYAYRDGEWVLIEKR